jgi:hypothetical protein
MNITTMFGFCEGCCAMAGTLAAATLATIAPKRKRLDTLIAASGGLIQSFPKE